MKTFNELLTKHPSYFNSLAYAQDVEGQPRKFTFVFSQPRCGSTLLLRLMNLACGTNMTGDLPIEYYRDLLSLYNQTTEFKFKSVVQSEEEGEFPDTHRGCSEGISRSSIRWGLRSLLSGRYYSAWMKSGILGFGNDFIPNTIELINDVYNGFDITICWLTRPHDEIISSAKDIGLMPDENIYRNFLAQQLEYFRENRELGQPWIKYEDILKDPVSVLKKLNPVYEPHEPSVKKVMDKKIRI